ncbi:MAG: hypothetical protein RJR37_00915 [Peptococcaceae bacterium MAG4]|nr:hypothetical protein [Peptococcaceae bacterium MAG4]
MTKYEKTAAKAIDAHLRQNRDRKDFTLYSLSVVADQAAFAAGKKRKLYSSLSSYEKLLPKGAKVFWKSNGFLSVTNPYCPNSSDSLAEKATFMPGPYDACVDMGPDSWKDKILKNKVV